MKYAEIISATATASGCDEAEAQRVLESFFKVLSQRFVLDDAVDLHRDFGRFVISEKEGHVTGHNGSQMTKSERRAAFRPAAPLREMLRQSDKDYIAMLRRNGKHAHADRMERVFAEQGSLPDSVTKE